jgi:hypothetical protein
VSRSGFGLRQSIKFLALAAAENRLGEMGLARGLSSYPEGSLLIGGLSEYALFEYGSFELGKDSDLAWFE